MVLSLQRERKSIAAAVSSVASILIAALIVPEDVAANVENRYLQFRPFTTWSISKFLLSVTIKLQGLICGLIAGRQLNIVG